ncbi:SH3 domain-containing protein C23A1.17 [Tripterygium wilfordii]|uniref:SH3 domain-containing protein C23A1.17 n=1 Tax=Tripterygium wilfordii TaxID=458696 RepID=A0A7J7CR09_TRIWF|nr:uncharacterized protein LOC120015482 [Tripterygium wilfordii]KAF5736399.1 SH3 domain-containing protein C23A1.17 [Tripterygium wilfordii]
MNSKTTNPPKIPATATTAAMASTPASTTSAMTSTPTNTATRPLITATASAPSPPLQSRPHPPLSHAHPYQIQQHQHQPPYAAIQFRTTQNPNQTQQVPNSSTTTSQGVLYPVASSGRGFISNSNRPPLRQEHAVTVVNPGAYPPLPVGYPRAHSVMAVSPHFDGALNLRHLVRHPTPHLQQQHQFRQHVGNAAVGGGVIKGVPVSRQQKVASSPSPASDSNGHKSTRDRNRNDTTIIRGRKVKISDGASLYALCRSWLRNGVPEESQPQYGDGLKSLPRPLPIPPAEAHRPTGNDGNEEVEEDAVDEESADHLSTDDLLKRHIKRAKKVRSRLREERLKRIARYKTRLALLLPPLIEQFRNDTNTGN